MREDRADFGNHEQRHLQRKPPTLTYIGEYRRICEPLQRRWPKIPETVHGNPLHNLIAGRACVVRREDLNGCDGGTANQRNCLIQNERRYRISRPARQCGCSDENTNVWHQRIANRVKYLISMAIEYNVKHWVGQSNATGSVDTDKLTVHGSQPDRNFLAQTTVQRILFPFIIM